MSVTAIAHGTEPNAKAAASPYAAVALADAKARPAALSEFQMERMPPHPMRASMTSNEVLAVGTNPTPPRTIRVVLDPEAVASFPIEGEDAPIAAPVAAPVAPVFGSHDRLLSIRKNLDDDSGVFERAGATNRLIRRSLDDAGDWASVSAGRRLRSTLD